MSKHPRDSAPSLDGAFDAMLRQRALILVSGKGGVGKSTVVAALARRAAHCCGGALAVEVATEARLPELIDGEPGVQAINIALDEALPRVLSRMLHVPQLVTSMISNRVLRLFVKTSPAVSETVLLDELFELVRQHRQRAQPVIVDLPATGHAVSLLDTPRAVRRMLRVGPVAVKAQKIEKLLLDPTKVELVIVSLPEELPVNETIDLVQRAGELGLRSRTVIVNQVPPSHMDEQDRELIERLRQHDDHTLLATAGAIDSEIVEMDRAREQIRRLRQALDGPVHELPLMAGLGAAARAGAIEQSLRP